VKELSPYDEQCALGGKKKGKHHVRKKGGMEQGEMQRKKSKSDKDEDLKILSEAEISGKAGCVRQNKTAEKRHSKGGGGEILEHSRVNWENSGIIENEREGLA